ncbi:cytochrome c oxidase subunit II [Sphingomonas quercus]|uniref:Cytochrome c oxidase subunit II n=1 Tax=Sphingomonas quercus TaxID=2842451 RepID=A0ABS6BM08_9SPHN|nr:cytochrome c oxidase subunit II [Sphingomonas quercus]MBU3079352.1 cytochrome c oxidase subunit II [Sphingomonas quercus]
MNGPLAYLDGFGRRADIVVPLTWAVTIISIAVCIVIAALLWMAIRRGREAAGVDAMAVRRSEGGMRFITIGLAVSLVPLLVTLVWTMSALAAIGAPPRRARVEIDVTAHQWWWQADYAGDQPSLGLRTANEIHIPVGEPVLLRLRGADVIHSFWVPKLSGKTDLIPGQTNLTWIEANAPGRYRGQCAEYCGLQHAHMAFEVVADTPAQFAAWRQAQLQTAPPAATPQQARGRALVEYRCALCHTVRGTIAGSNVGPDLTHLMSRSMIAAGTLPNDSAHLAGWIVDPQSFKPGSLMPAQALTGDQLADVTAYLETLK